MQKLTWLGPLILAASFSARAWEMNNIHRGQPHAYPGTNNGFGLSMGFGGSANGRDRYENRPVILPGVNFKYDSAEPTPESNAILDNVASELRKTPEISVEVVGHASAEGKVAYNMRSVGSGLES